MSNLKPLNKDEQRCALTEVRKPKAKEVPRRAQCKFWLCNVSLVVCQQYFTCKTSLKTLNEPVGTADKFGKQIEFTLCNKIKNQVDLFGFFPAISIHQCYLTATELRGRINLCNAARSLPVTFKSINLFYQLGSI